MGDNKWEKPVSARGKLPTFQLTSLTDRLCLHHMGVQSCLSELPKRKLCLHLSMVAEPLCLQGLGCI